MKTIVNFDEFKEVMKKLRLEGGTISIENMSIETLDGKEIKYTTDFNTLYNLEYTDYTDVYLIEEVWDAEYDEDSEEFSYDLIRSNRYTIYAKNSLVEPDEPLKAVNYNEIYSLDELLYNSKDRAIYSIIIDWLNSRGYDYSNKGNYEKAIDKSKEDLSEEFVCEYIYDYCLDEIKEFANKNKYIYNEDGIRIL